MKNLFLLTLLIAFAGCSSDFELKKSVFQPDPEYPGLPIYSEWGYNTFGAYYDRSVFVSNDDEVPLKVINRDGMTSFVFSGEFGSAEYESGRKPFTMTISVSGFEPMEYEDLLILDQQTVDLSDDNYEVTFDDGSEHPVVEILSGVLEFKRAQHLFVDEVSQQVILSGTFNLNLLIDTTPVIISEGRFDAGVGSSNFFLIQ